MPKHSFFSSADPVLTSPRLKHNDRHADKELGGSQRVEPSRATSERTSGPRLIRQGRACMAIRFVVFRLSRFVTPVTTIWVVIALGSTCITASAADAPPPRSAPRIQPWLAYLQTLESQVRAGSAVQSAQAGVKANQVSVSAQTGDVDLSLDASYTDYPNGAGTGSNGSFTDLQQRGEIRASWGLLDFFGRRPGRIDNAQAHVKAARADMAYTRQDNEQALISRSVTAWTANYQQQALQNAMQDVNSVNHALDELQNHVLNTRLTNAVTLASSQALELQSKIEQGLASLPVQDKSLPAPPSSYWVLPLNAPAATQIKQIAHADLRAQKLRYQSKAFDAQSRAYWADDFHFKIYGGYVRQKLRDQSGSRNGPELGANLSIPIGGAGSGERANAHWQARQLALAAQAAVEQQGLLLQQMRQQWTQSKANLHSQTVLISREAQQINQMLQRYSADIGSNSPEPWQVRLEGARFWLAVAETWQTRGQWIETVLAWSVFDDNDYLKAHVSSAPAAGLDSLCAPLEKCPQV